MRPSSPHFFPLAAPILVAFFLALVLLVAFIEVGFIGYAYEKIGIDRRHAFTLLMLSLLGSYVNIPVAELPAEHVMSDRVSSSSACGTWCQWSRTGRARSSP